MPVKIEFCGEWFVPDPVRAFEIGRDGDLRVDDNPYLHRRFLTVEYIQDLWWLCNLGRQLSATVSDRVGGFQAWLAPGGRIPLVFTEMMVLFTAGPTTYELMLVNDEASYRPAEAERTENGETTIGPMALTLTQKQLIVALAEPLLRREGSSISSIPSSKDAALRLGWEQTRFNRKLDNVCDKLYRRGVRGLRGEVGQLAVNRRARLVEHAVSTRLVTAADLRVLDMVAP